jgi:uncharacterized membrane protein YdjX (TVP38/TMEM64 family)
MIRSLSIRWMLLATIMLAIILAPFLAWGGQIESWTNDFLQSSQEHVASTAVILGLLLASDIFLPIPSSIVGTSAGFLLGFLGGTVASFLGMTAGCLLGYAAGFSSRRIIAVRFLGIRETERLEDLFQRFGDWTIALARPVPVLAEASVMFAGLSRMRVARFMLVSTLSNFGISAVYAVVGAFSFSVNSFFLALAAAIVVPAIAILCTRNNKKTFRDSTMIEQP